MDEWMMRLISYSYGVRRVKIFKTQHIYCNMLLKACAPLLALIQNCIMCIMFLYKCFLELGHFSQSTLIMVIIWILQTC